MKLFTLCIWLSVPLFRIITYCYIGFLFLGLLIKWINFVNCCLYYLLSHAHAIEFWKTNLHRKFAGWMDTQEAVFYHLWSSAVCHSWYLPCNYRLRENDKGLHCLPFRSQLCAINNKCCPGKSVRIFWENTVVKDLARLAVLSLLIPTSILFAFVWLGLLLTPKKSTHGIFYGKLRK